MSTIENEVVEYPESDGMPMGETDWHIYWTLQLRQLLQAHYHGQNVYVGSDMFIYYEQGHPNKVIAPDCFVVFDCDPKFRRVFKLWEENRVPSVVFELASRSSVTNDLMEKPELYASWGVQEYFVFDPECECLTPALRGFKLYPGRKVEMEGPQFKSATLNCLVQLRDRQLEFLDSPTNRRWLTEAESEREARQQLECENAELRAEIERLRQRTENE